MRDDRWLIAWGLGSVALGAASLLVPLYVVALGGDSFDLGLLGAVAALIGAPGAFLWGRIADRTSNPRAVVLFSLVGAGILLTVVPLVSVIFALIVANALLWLVFSAAGPVLTLLVVADVPEHEWNQAIALLNKYQGYGWALGLLLGITWSAIASQFVSQRAIHQYLFVLCGGIAGFAAVLLDRWMPAPSKRQLGRVDVRRVARSLSAGRRSIRGATFLFTPNRLYWSMQTIHPARLVDRFTPTLAVYFLGVVFFFTGFSAFFAPLPLYLTGVGFSPDLVFGLYLVSSLGSAAFYAAAGHLSSSFDLRLLQTGALGVRGIAMPLVAVVGAMFATNTIGTVVTSLLFLLLGVTWAVIAVTGGTIVTRIAPATLRGEVLGVYSALSILAGGIGSIVGGALASAYNFTVAFGSAGAVILAGAGLVAGLRDISIRTNLTLDTPPSSQNVTRDNSPED